MRRGAVSSFWLLASGFLLLASGFLLPGGELTPEARGYRNLTQHAYGRPLVQPKILENAWRVWEPEWRARVMPDDPEGLRRVLYERYGFCEAPYENGGAPMQYTATPKGWVPSCMLCHGGRVPGTGTPMVGMPNTELDWPTLAEDLAASFGMKTDQSRLGRTRGRTNAQMFAIELLRMRNEDLSMRTSPIELATYRSGDLDPIPWWHLKRKTRLYCDGGITGEFTRPIMQFALAGPTGDEIRSWEQEFDDILAYLRSIEPPRYPFAIDRELAGAGRKVFERTCAPCHGTYGTGGTYGNRVVPIDIVGTDRVRLEGIPREFRQYFNRTWFAEKAHAEEQPAGYVAPPLDGVWASAPYFHNGSVPTVYAVLDPGVRPRYFRRVGGAKEYDTRDLGFKFEALSGPARADLPAEARRRVIDTTLPGLSNEGHTFAATLSETEKRQVLEYLKTL